MRSHFLLCCSVPNRKHPDCSERMQKNGRCDNSLLTKGRSSIEIQSANEKEVTLRNGSETWYDSYVSYAVANGIIEKDYASYTAAHMNAAITRAEFVHIFHGAESTYKAINQVADGAIPDVKSGDAFASDIYEFYRAGILTGSDAKGTFHPASSIKRSEVATILLRMFEAAARVSIDLP